MREIERLQKATVYRTTVIKVGVSLSLLFGYMFFWREKCLNCRVKCFSVVEGTILKLLEGFKLDVRCLMVLRLNLAMVMMSLVAMFGDMLVLISLRLYISGSSSSSAAIFFAPHYAIRMPKAIDLTRLFLDSIPRSRGDPSHLRVDGIRERPCAARARLFGGLARWTTGE